jgi:tRNA 2-thiouridine synthesizing protein E
MLQTNKLENAFTTPSYDRPYNLEALGPWSEEMAHQLAAKEGISLTPEHFEVIDALRNHYQQHGLVANGRSLLRCMEVEFADLGGKQYLYGLFPRGPVTQACRISGLPVPPHSIDLSFGTAL